MRRLSPKEMLQLLLFILVLGFFSRSCTAINDYFEYRKMKNELEEYGFYQRLIDFKEFDRKFRNELGDFVSLKRYDDNDDYVYDEDDYVYTIGGLEIIVDTISEDEFDGMFEGKIEGISISYYEEERYYYDRERYRAKVVENRQDDIREIIPALTKVLGHEMRPDEIDNVFRSLEENDTDCDWSSGYRADKHYELYIKRSCYRPKWSPWKTIRKTLFIDVLDSQMVETAIKVSKRS